MKQSTKILVVIALVILMLLSGLLLPTLVELMAGGANGAVTTVPVEALRFESSSSSVIEILQRINEGPEDLSGEVLSTRNLTEGYQYTMETAHTHAKELIVDYLNNCSFKAAADYYEKTFSDMPVDLTAMMVAAADYPVPWSAILWSVECVFGTQELYLLFDDASGAMLSCSIPLIDETEEVQAAQTELADTCMRQFAEQLETEVIHSMDLDLTEYFFRIADESGETAYLRMLWYEMDDIPVLTITGETNDEVEAWAFDMAQNAGKP